MRTINIYQNDTIYNKLKNSCNYSKSLIFYLVRNEINYLSLKYKPIDFNHPKEVKKTIKEIKLNPNFNRFIITK